MKRIETCERCGGVGSVPVRAPGNWDPYAHGAPERVECPDCDGRGVTAVEEDDEEETRSWTCQVRVACEGTVYVGERLPVGWALRTPNEDEPLYRELACPACTQELWLKGLSKRLHKREENES